MNPKADPERLHKTVARRARWKCTLNGFSNSHRAVFSLPAEHDRCLNFDNPVPAHFLVLRFSLTFMHAFASIAAGTSDATASSRAGSSGFDFPRKCPGPFGPRDL